MSYILAFLVAFMGVFFVACCIEQIIYISPLFCAMISLVIAAVYYSRKTDKESKSEDEDDDRSNAVVVEAPKAPVIEDEKISSKEIDIEKTDVEVKAPMYWKSAAVGAVLTIVAIGCWGFSIVFVLAIAVLYLCLYFHWRTLNLNCRNETQNLKIWELAVKSGRTVMLYVSFALLHVGAVILYLFSWDAIMRKILTPYAYVFDYVNNGLQIIMLILSLVISGFIFFPFVDKLVMKKIEKNVVEPAKAKRYAELVSIKDSKLVSDIADRIIRESIYYIGDRDYDSISFRFNDRITVNAFDTAWSRLGELPFDLSEFRGSGLEALVIFVGERLRAQNTRYSAFDKYNCIEVCDMRKLLDRNKLK